MSFRTPSQAAAAQKNQTIGFDPTPQDFRDICGGVGPAGKLGSGAFARGTQASENTAVDGVITRKSDGIPESVRGTHGAE